MAQQIPEFKNILVIHFGQLGDVVLGLPALKAIRNHFPDATITVMSGTSTAAIIRLGAVADEQIAVDRVELRDGNTFRSIAKILKLIKEIRGRKFDFVIDLHSLSETNILGYLSGSKWRLYANRENRSLDRLGRFPARPPKEDKSKHHADRYFDAIKPLGIPAFDHKFQLQPPDENVAEIKNLFSELGIIGKTLIGFFIGAGHRSRCWSNEKFAELALRLVKNSDHAVLVFFGPEEAHLVDHIRETFPPEAIILDKLKLLPFMAAAASLKVLVSNDTGTMHLAAIAGAPIVLILDKRAPDCFLPIAQRLRVLNDGTIDEITVDQVFNAVHELLAGSTE